jgi:hypothetical protein
LVGVIHLMDTVGALLARVVVTGRYGELAQAAIEVPQVLQKPP